MDFQQASTRRRAEERLAGIGIARAVGAPQTRAAIEDPDVCYDGIMQTAAGEVGHDRLVSKILEHDEPSWAQHALSFVPDLSAEHQQALRSKASVVLGAASSFELDLIIGVGYSCQFTLFWTNPQDGSVFFPNAVIGDSLDWHWSEDLAVGQSAIMNIADVAVANGPVEPGATVWMNVSIDLGQWYSLPQWSFTYDTDGPLQPFVATGSVDTPHFFPGPQPDQLAT